MDYDFLHFTFLPFFVFLVFYIKKKTLKSKDLYIILEKSLVLFLRILVLID